MELINTGNDLFDPISEQKPLDYSTLYLTRKDRRLDLPPLASPGFPRQGRRRRARGASARVRGDRPRRPSLRQETKSRGECARHPIFDCL